MPIESKPPVDHLKHIFDRLAVQYQLDYIYGIAPEDSRARERIIKNGIAFLPLIMQDFEENPSPWFPLLTIITGAKPVDKKHLGDVPKMAEAWRVWYKEYKGVPKPSAPTLTPTLGAA